MKYQRYADTESFSRDVREVLLLDEAQNFLMLSFLDNKTDVVKNWLLTAVFDEEGNIVLTAACTPPFNIVLYETNNRPSGAAVSLLADELKRAAFPLPGVLAERGLAERFAKAYAGDAFSLHMTMTLMRLDAVSDIKKTAGYIRPIREEDLFFAPYWQRAFGEECRVEFYSIPETTEQLREQLGNDTCYIWEDTYPVSQAAVGHVTPNGAVINGVYTPPHYRGRGYAASCVAELSQHLLDRGQKYCALFADADNPISCGIYRKIGYRDTIGFADVKFKRRQHG